MRIPLEHENSGYALLERMQARTYIRGRTPVFSRVLSCRTCLRAGRQSNESDCASGAHARPRRFARKNTPRMYIRRHGFRYLHCLDVPGASVRAAR